MFIFSYSAQGAWVKDSVIKKQPIDRLDVLSYEADSCWAGQCQPWWRDTATNLQPHFHNNISIKTVLIPTSGVLQLNVTDAFTFQALKADLWGKQRYFYHYMYIIMTVKRINKYISSFLQCYSVTVIPRYTVLAIHVEINESSYVSTSKRIHHNLKGFEAVLLY